MCSEFLESLAEIDRRKVAEVVRRSCDKKRLCDPFFALFPKPIARFRWKRARLSLFRPQPHVPSFIQIDPSFRDLLAKTTFRIITIIGDPIFADNEIKYCTTILTKTNNQKKECKTVGDADASDYE